MGKSSTPEPPDPFATAQAQGDQNIRAAVETTKLGRTNIATPTGSVWWKDLDEDGIPDTQVTTLTPAAQQQTDERNALASLINSKAIGAVGGLTPQNTDLSVLPAWRGPSNVTFGAASKAAQDAAFDRAMALIRPEQERRQRALDNTLAITGNPNSAEGNQLERNRSDRAMAEEELAAARDAVGVGNQIEAQEFGQDITNANLQNQVRAGQLGEQIQHIMLPYQQAGFFLDNSIPVQIPTAPGSASAGISPTDIAGLVQGGYNAKAGNVAANNQAKTQAGTAALTAAAAIGAAAL